MIDSIIKNYSEMLEVMSHTTDDYLFVLDIRKDINYFFGDIDRQYAIRKEGSETNTTLEMLNIVHPKDQSALLDELALIVRGESKVHDLDYRWINRKGDVVWINCCGEVIDDQNGDPAIMVGRVSEEALRHLFNPLTGLWNKVKLRQDMESLLHTGSGSLMLLDINGLAAINLSHGRAYGDQLLRDIAALLDNMEHVTGAYHIDHNNFALTLDCKRSDEVRNVLRTIQCEIAGRCSFTACSVPIDKKIFIDAAQLIDSANITLKRAKQMDSELEFFSPDEIERNIAVRNLLDELKQNIQNDFEGFYVYYQPQVSAGEYRVCAAEALLRYRSNTRGMVYPDEFIPVLEQSHLIDKVGLWVLEQALTQCKKWRTHIPGMRVSVNFSPVQFEDRSIAEKIVAILKKLDLPGDALTVEITESTELQNNVHFNNRIKYLKAYGIRFALDDFGTGYSNLGYLKQMTVDEIKVDRIFVTGIEENTYNYNLISNLITFAKTNSIVVCCEGIETARELAVLESLNPDKLQGYLFDKPLPASTFEKTYIEQETEAYRNRCAFIEELYAFKREQGVIHFDPRDILRVNEIGLWMIRISTKEDRCEMYADATMEKVLAVEHKYTPMECYSHWFSRIHPDYVDYVRTNVEKMITIDKAVQLEYPWLHPILGDVMVRCSGRRVKNADGMVVLEGYHRIISDLEGI